MVERNFVPGSPAEYQLKDMRTAQAFAGKLGLHLTLLDSMVGIFSDMIANEGNGVDVAGVMLEIERRSQVFHTKLEKDA
jgi:2-hydroxy-3-oxopropionate reductase